MTRSDSRAPQLQNLQTGPDIGLVLTGRNNIFTVQLGDLTLLCRLRGKRLEIDERSYNPLAPGDLVAVGSIDTEHATGVIEERMERTSAFLRFNRKRNTPQTLAANIEEVICIASISRPPYHPRFVDRFLALAEDQGVRASVIVNKADLDPPAARAVAEGYRMLGYVSYALSAIEPEWETDLREYFGSRLVAVIGQSGVGKSTLLNALVGDEIQKIGNVSARFHRGRHTTNAARLVQSAEFRIVDTPGVQDLEIRTIEKNALAWCFREFREFTASCRHSDCMHADEPGCAIRAAVESDRIRPERYANYLEFLTELHRLENETT